jgi:hypothetical protein
VGLGRVTCALAWHLSGELLSESWRVQQHSTCYAAKAAGWEKGICMAVNLDSRLCRWMGMPGGASTLQAQCVLCGTGSSGFVDR